jgi:hypothetical protein
MGILRNIALTVGLILAVVFRVYPSAAETVTSPHLIMQSTVIQDNHKVNLSSDSAIYFIQDEDEQHSPTVDQDFLAALPVEWQRQFTAPQALQPNLLIPVGKRAGPSQPYYLLFCSLRIPSV